MTKDGKWEGDPGGPRRESAPPTETGHEGYARSSARHRTAGAKQRAREKGEEMKESAGQKAEELEETASQKADELKEGAVRRTDELTTRMGGRIGTLARALRRAGDDMRNDGESRFAEMSDRAAGRVERFGSYLEDKDPHSMMSDIERSAREHPAYFVAGTFAVGLLLGRFLRSGEPRTDERSDGLETYSSDRDVDWSSDIHLEDAAENPAFGEAR
jgi:hypothetical protein